MKKYILIASRIGSYALDYVIFLILMYLIGKTSVMWYLLVLVLFFIYRYITTAIYGGTLGMMLLSLTLDSYSFRICFKREVLRFASAFYYIGYIYGVFDSMGRTFHDIGANTFVRYRSSKAKVTMEPFVLKYIIYVLLIISITKWSASFILNDIGGIGLKKICTSEEYTQSFDGDNLISYTQQELYLNTLGRKYTAIVDFGKKPFLIRISNKLTYTEIYKLKINSTQINSEYAYKIGIPLQFICSGIFRSKMELCGISPNKKIVVVDEYGDLIGENVVNIPKVISLKCGDIDNDGKSELVALGRNGEIEIFKYENRDLNAIYNGRIQEDILPQAFYIDKGIIVATKSKGRSLIYSYSYKNNKFLLTSKKSIKEAEISNMTKIDSMIVVSNINRSNVILGVGNTQKLECYGGTAGLKRIYNFGDRPSRGYSYLIRNLEGVYDIDGDGTEELILKAVEKGDAMGGKYVVEIYKFNKIGLRLNRVLTWISGVL